MKQKICALVAVLALLMLCGPGWAAEPAAKAGSSGFSSGLMERDTLTDNWFGFGKQLEEQALTARLDFMQVYQLLASGGGDTHMHAGRWTGRYNFSLEYDLSKHVGIQGGSLHAVAAGSWSDGLNVRAVRSITDPNGSASGYEWAVLEQLYYQQYLFNNAVMVRIGKIGLGDFDRNAYAEDSLTQFLNASLSANPTIAWPQAGLGVMADFWFREDMYIAAASVDAEADRREMGTNTAFHDDTGWFSIVELGWLPKFGQLPGGYRIGAWWDCQDKRQEDIVAAKVRRCDWGMYISGHQLIWKENNQADDLQGLGVFFRWGMRPEHVSLFEHSWSVGAQYEGLIPTRDKDVIGFGVVSLCLPDRVGFNEPSETAYEIYYTANIAPWLSVGTSFQYITELAGDNAGVEDAMLCAVRMLMRF